MRTREYIPYQASHPGSLIKDELDFRNISQKDFARDIGMQPTMLNELIKGKRAITSDIALSLEKAIEIPADYWMRYQINYELDCARIQERNIQKSKQIEIWSIIKQYVPVSIFSKLGILSTSLTDNITRIWEIYEVNSIDSLIEKISANKNMEFYKKSDKLKSDQINIIGWSHLARWQVKSQKTSAFNPVSKNLVVNEMNEIFYNNLDVEVNISQTLKKYGIKFLILERFKQSPIDGYTFWSDVNPAIVVTMRKKTLDNFAFTLMHELGHVFEHLQSNTNEDFLDIEYPNSSISIKEQEAHKFAQQCFIADSVWNEFLAKNPIYNYSTTEQEILQLADQLKIHPSILIGRYCFESGNFAIKTNIDRTIH